MKRTFKIGCISVLSFFGIVILYFVFEPKSCRDERIKSLQQDRDSAQYYVAAVSKRMALVKSRLPLLTEGSNPQPFPPGNIDWSITLQTSAEEVNHFTDSGFVTQPPLRWGPWLTEPMQTIEDSFDTTRSKNIYNEIKHGRMIMKMKYLMVYLPLYHEQPRVIDKKTFQPGYFDGWMIYVDFINGKPLGYARFQSFTTLYKMEYDKIGIGVGPVSIPLVSTTNVQEELTEDFRKEFFKKTDSTFQAFKGAVQY